VAYDEDLADRIRELLEGTAELTEKKMFGGLAFLIGGNMAVAASGQGGLLVRVDPATSGDLIGSAGVRPMQMRDRELDGWLLIDLEQVSTQGDLARWVQIGATFAGTLPTKG
jgi:hypothetical protein